jgi:hypothetical protein
MDLGPIGAAGRAHRSLAPQQSPAQRAARRSRIDVMLPAVAVGRAARTPLAWRLNSRVADEPMQRGMCIAADGGIRTPADSFPHSSAEIRVSVLGSRVVWGWESFAYVSQACHQIRPRRQFRSRSM